MSILSKLFARKNHNEVMKPLYDAIVSEGRRSNWYETGKVPDSVDGRFDMILVIFCLVLIRLEADKTTQRQSAWLTELFVTDMDGQLRQIGIGDMIVGKHIGKMMEALGGRLGAYRKGLNESADFSEALIKNLFRGEHPGDAPLSFCDRELKQFYQNLKNTDSIQIVAGEISETEK